MTMLRNQYGRLARSPDSQDVPALCGCVNHIDGRITFCRTHRADERMRALVKCLVDASGTVPILKEPPWTVTDVLNALPMMTALEEARALMRELGA